jgi:hypothetical protein
LSRKSSYVTILQFGGGVISALRARQENGAPHIDRMFTERFDTPPAWPEAIKEFVDANGLAGDQFYTVIPRHEITARIIDLPSHDPDEIAGMVALNAEEFVPFAADDLTTAFTVLDRAAAGTSKVLAAVVHQDVLHAHLKTLREAGIAPRQVLLSTACLMEAVAASPPPKATASPSSTLRRGASRSSSSTKGSSSTHAESRPIPRGLPRPRKPAMKPWPSSLTKLETPSPRTAANPSWAPAPPKCTSAQIPET